MKRDDETIKLVLKRVIGVVLIILFFLLDFAALDDITTGNEPKLIGEYAALVISVPVFILVFKWAFGKKRVDIEA